MPVKPLILGLTILILLVLGLPPINLHFASWIAWILLFQFFYKTRKNIGRLLVSTALLGLCYFATGLAWVATYSREDYLLLVLLSAPFFTIYFSILMVLIRETDPIPVKIAATSALWFLFSRGLDLSPMWSAPLGVFFYAPLKLLPAISFTGFQLFSALILATTCALALAGIKKSRIALLLAILIALFLSGLAFFGQKTSNSKLPSPGKIKLALIQHHLPDSENWLRANNNEIRNIYRRLAETAARRKIDLIVFPRYDTFENLEEVLPFYLDLARSLATPILLARHIEISREETTTPDYQNTALLLGTDGKVRDFYQTVRAPFFITREQTAPEMKVLSVGGGKAGILLCTENIWPDLARRSVQKGAEFLIALSYPGLFNTPTLSYYQTMQDRFRAIESGRPVALVSSHGLTALIDPQGRVIAEVPQNQEAILYADIELRHSQTFFYRWGFLWDILAAVFLLGLLGSRFLKRHDTPFQPSVP